MGKLLREKVRPVFEIIVWPWPDRIVGHCVCNSCGERFSVTLHANPVALKTLVHDEKFISARLLSVAQKKHFCDEDSLKADPAETNRIVNKWHEYKIKAKKILGSDK